MSFVVLLLVALLQTQPSDPLLRARFPASGAAPQLRLGDETFQGSADLPCFYERRGYAPAWSREPADEGLRPEEYREGSLRQLAGQASTPAERVELDLLLTDAFLRYARDVQSGRVDPQKLYRDCKAEPARTDLPALLESGLASGSLRRTLDGLPPPHEGYRRLREALARYRRMAEGAPTEDLRERLARAAEADAAPLAESLDQAVRDFQERHGLEVDGVVGPKTLAALTAPVSEHIHQLELNLERLRWLPRDIGRRHVLVNIAGFWLRAVEDGRVALESKVIVGKPYTRTPMFSASMTRVVFNPYWYVPNSIATKEIAPKLRRDPGYLARNHYEHIPGRSGLALRQRPGPDNALGRIKFLFPNRFNVYLHDTPSRSLFERTVRTFSHGCMRVEKPLELGDWVLEGTEWTPEALRAAIDSGRNREIALERSIPVHVAYWTAWVDDAGVLQMRGDVYDRDEPLENALGED
jgi:murein L,D-transpeptidase YcbB/YkuD